MHIATGAEPEPDGVGEDGAREVLAGLDLGVLAVGADGLATYANRSWERLSGQLDGQWRGRGWQRLLAGGGCDVDRLLRSARDGEARVEVLIESEGPPRVLRLSGCAAGSLVVVTGRDVSEERAATEALTRAATRDPLTGLWNRTQFFEFLTQALAHQQRDPSRHAAVFFVDIDDLKATNDEGGHAAGDRLLQSVARCITSAVRPGDVVARYAGDEFIVLCGEIDDEAEAFAIAGRILDAVATSPDARCSVSLGISTSTGAHDDPSSVVARADADMYRVKRRSKRRSRSATSVGRAVQRPSLVVAAHELAQPLTTLGGFARLLLDSWDDLEPDERKDAVLAVARLLVRLQLAVDDVVALAAALDAGGHPQIVDVGHVIARSVQSAPPPPGVEVRVDVDGGSSRVPVGGEDLRRIVVHLLTHTYRRGVTEVVVRGRTVAGHLVVEVGRDGEHLGSVPTPLVQVDGCVRGGNHDGRQVGLPATGTGLALVRDVVQAVGGVFTAEPTGPRAQLRVRLPLVE